MYAVARVPSVSLSRALAGMGFAGQALRKQQVRNATGER
jgi:hypothetical protein